MLYIGLTSSHLAAQEQKSSYHHKKTKQKNRSKTTYDELYPYYMKYCSASRYHPKKKFGRPGGSPGHAILFLKGACLDKTSSPFRLKICNLQDDYTNPELGVGISTNRHFKNVNFVNIPSQKIFFGTNNMNNQNFTPMKKNLLIKKFIQEGYINGIEFHKNKKLPQNIDPIAYYAHNMFGTDYAISLARNLYCINIPINRELTKIVIQKLNHVNDSYGNSYGQKYRGSSKKDNSYHWHGIYDNCTHTLINLLAHLGIIKEKKANQAFFKQLKNIAIPSNTLLTLHKKLNLKKINLKKYYTNPKRKNIFLKHNWIPQQPGNLLQKISFYQNNEVYQKDDKMLVIPDFFKSKTRIIRRIMHQPEFDYLKNSVIDKTENLVFYEKKYQKTIKKIRKKLENFKSNNKSNEIESDYQIFIKKFLQTLINKSMDIKRKLKGLES